VRRAADALVRQLSANDPSVRDKAATALQAMGSNAAKALAHHVSSNLLILGTKPENRDAIIQDTTKTVTVLTKIGNDIADDCEVRVALLAAAGPDGTKWALRLAAIDALGEINKYRGGVLLEESSSPSGENPSGSVDLPKVTAAADKLVEIAEQVFDKSTGRSVPTPTPTPPWENPFYAQLKILGKSQSKLTKASAQVKAVASLSKSKEPAFSKLADPETLAASLKKIEVSYLEATKTIDPSKLKLENASDKPLSQFQTESGYDLLIETTQLKEQLDSLNKAMPKQADLTAVLTRLADICDESSEPDKSVVANAINAVFSKPPEKTPAAGEAKKDGVKKGAGKKDADKKDDAAAKDGDKEKSKSQ
jgi:hypothetical protein